MTRLLPMLLVAPLFALAGCGGDDRVTVRGYARFETGDTFEFPTDVRIDAGGTLTGNCLITRSTPGGGTEVVREVVVNLYTSGETGARSVTVRAGSGAGSVRATLQSGVYESGASCTIETEYVDDYGSATLHSEDCALATADGGTTLADLHLELHGCRVQ